jgi:hypothetical protein
MLLRRSLYYAQFALAIIMPAWVLVSRGVLADGIGAALVVYALVCPILTVALLAISGLIRARKQVRTERAVSYLDAALLSALWLGLFVYGLFAVPLLAVALVMLITASFWAVLYELFHETRARVKGYLDLGPTGGYATGTDVIVVPPKPVSR